jgi:hypothetical protein
MRLIALDVNTFSLLAASYVALWANRSDCENIVLVAVEPTPSISANPACDVALIDTITSEEFWDLTEKPDEAIK